MRKYADIIRHRTDLGQIQWIQFSKGYYFRLDKSDEYVYCVNLSRIPFVKKYALAIYDKNGDFFPLEILPNWIVKSFIKSIETNIRNTVEFDRFNKSLKIYHELEQGI